MKLGIRSKMVLLLAIVALLPLLAAVGVIAYEFDHVRRETIGEGMRGLAHSEAIVHEVSLTKDVERLLLLMEEPEIRETVNDPPKLSEAQWKELDRQWPKMPLDDPRMKAVLLKPGTAVIQRIRKSDPRIKEILVTDRHGQLVAATGRTSDYYQADESWWQEAFNHGTGAVHVPPVSFDDSSKTWSIDLCVPVVAEGKVIGVTKTVLDVSQWMQLQGSGDSPRSEGEPGLMLVDNNGTILYRRGVVPLSRKIPMPPDLVKGESIGWRLTDQEMQSYASIHLPEKINGLPMTAPKLTVFLYLPESFVLHPVYTLTALTAGVGLAVVCILFMLGVLLIDRSLTRRILWLQHTTDEAAKGDFSQRIRTERPGGRILGRDEIDDLAAGFNTMLQQVQRSTTELQSANELKSNFIRVAGHELRTPISYILGMARLLKDSNDPARLSFAVQSMGAKARRLNEIVQAMFKLMPEGFHGESMVCSRVNLSELLEEIYIDVFPFVELRNQRLTIEMVDRLPALNADRNKLRDIVENLLMNAVKFTPDGGAIKVRCSLQLGDRVMISVQDQGPGIPESEYPRLFQPFYSGADVMTHSTGEAGYQKRGMGLGLAIVKHFAQLHHGTVHVSSSSSGATFSVTIPVDPFPGESKTNWPRPERSGGD